MRSSARSLYPIFALTLACLMAGSCKKVVKSFAELSTLRAAIVKEYGEENVHINLHNGTHLVITFINSPLNAKDTGERAKRAEQAAKFVSQHYSSINQIQEMWVSFVKQETHYLIMHKTEGLNAFGFDKNARPLSMPGELEAEKGQDSDLHSHAVYSEARKQTEVRITRIQLEGDLDYGLAVIPHFTVPGDATGSTRSTARPRTVSFDFASYSEKSIFPGEPKITLLADGKVVFEKAQQFSTSKGSDDKFFESLELQIPYSTFRRMIAGKRLILRIDYREYEFRGEHLKALRDMTKYIAE